MSSFSPYHIGLGFVRATGLNRVFSGRVSKPAISPSRTRSRAPATANSSTAQADPSSTPSPRALLGGVAAKHEPDDCEPIVKTEEVHDNDDDDDASSEGADAQIRAQGASEDPDHPWESIEGTDEDVLEESESSESFEEGLDESGGAQHDDETSYPQADWCINEDDLREYREARSRINGTEFWPKEFTRLHKLLYLRGQQPLMSSTWAGDLVDHPCIDRLFVPPGIEMDVLIYAVSSQFRATRALRHLFELHVRVSAYRQEGAHGKIADLIEKELKRYNRWAEEDAKMRKEYEYSSPVFIVKFNKVEAQAQEDVNFVTRQVGLAFRQRAREYRRAYRERGVEQYPYVIYGFVIIQHKVTIATMDSRDREADPLVVAQLDMSKKSNWLDSGLGVAIPIHLAREAICAYREDFPKREDDSDDPDT